MLPRYIRVLIALIVLQSCNKNPSPSPVDNSDTNAIIVQPGKLILNGDSWQNLELSWDDLYHDSLYNIAYNIAATNQSRIVKISNALANPFAVVNMQFKGAYKSSTSFSSETSLQVQLVYVGNRANTIYNSVNGKGTLNITRFENVGGYIEGNFSGTFINKDTGAQLQISSGQFSEKRLADR